MAYPPAPWIMHGDMWLSLFRVQDADSGHPDGLYGAAWVIYREPSPLTYHELLVARLRSDQPRGRSVVKPVTITDIWVDSIDSRDGGRDLWAIPKDVCTFEMAPNKVGPIRRTSWRAALEGQPIARASFTDASAVAPPAPLLGSTMQERADGTEVHAPIKGVGRVLPARAQWDFAPDGPLAFLAGRRSVSTVTITNFRMSFG